MLLIDSMPKRESISTQKDPVPDIYFKVTCSEAEVSEQVY